MKSQKVYEIQNLIEQIERVDKMVKFHSASNSRFMYNQYESEKEDLLSKLIDKLARWDNLSPYGFQLIFLAIKKYYPEIIKSKTNIAKQVKKDKELREVEAMLV